jgi:hypothetical protein
MLIPDPEFFPSRIQGSEKHRIPDLQNWVQVAKNLAK